jgi:hypothetical protein
MSMDSGHGTINYGATSAPGIIPADFVRWRGLGGVPPSDAYPCLNKFPVITSAEIVRGNGTGVSGGCQVHARDFAASDAPPMGLDPYYATRTQPVAGTFFPRLRARYPWMQNYPMLVVYYTWAPDGTRDIKSKRLYSISTIDGPDQAGNMLIKGTDLMAALDSKNDLVPRVDGSNLNGNINSIVTDITIADNVPGTWPPANGVFRVQDELIEYAAFDGTTASGCTRGTNGTTASNHSDGDRAQIVKVYNVVNVVDVIYDLMVNEAGLDPTLVPYNNDPGNPDEWDIEKSNYLAGHNITQYISEPKKVGELVRDLCTQCYLHLWYEPTTAQFRLAATNTRLAELDAIRITQEDNIIGGSIRMKERKKGIFTQAWVYFDKASPLLSDSTENYNSLFIDINTELEDDNAWGYTRISAILAYWLNGAGNIALTTASRALSENNSPLYEVTFQMDSKDAGILLGEFIVMKIRQALGVDGAPEDLSCQIIKVKELIPTVRSEYTARILRVVDPNFVARYGLIVATRLDNTEYDDADQADKDTYAWASTINGFGVDDPPYLIL